MSKISTCQHCGITFSITPGARGKYCSPECFAYGISKRYSAQARSKYLKNPKLCKHCNKVLDYEHKKNTFCNSSCAASYNNIRRNPRSEESKNKTKETLKNLFYANKLPLIRLRRESNPNYKHGKYVNNKTCVICGNKSGTRKTCSDECYRKLLSINQTEYLKKPENRKKYKGNRGPSYLETLFENWLIKNKIKKGIKGYLTELHFYNSTSNKHGWADFAFPAIKLIVELDGTQHRKTVEQDKIRDEYLRSKGYTVIRITYEEYFKYNWESKIKALLDNITNGPNGGSRTPIYSSSYD